MTATTTATDDVRRYLDAVGRHLGALPEPERADLLDDLHHHLLEVDAESDVPLDARLGAPSDYAAELIASAGLDAEAPTGSLAERLARTAACSRPARQLGVLWSSLTGSRAGAEVIAFLPEARPGWWVARAFLTVLLLVLLGLPGQPFLGVVLLVIAVPLSVAVGRRDQSRSGHRPVTLAFDVVLLFAVLLALGSVQSGADGDVAVYGESFPDPVGGIPSNIYPYDADGRPLEGVLLYDQDGRPIEVLAEVTHDGRPIENQLPVDAEGFPTGNAYPREQRVLEWSERGERFVPVQPPVVIVPPTASPDGPAAEEVPPLTTADPDTTPEVTATTTPSAEAGLPAG